MPLPTRRVIGELVGLEVAEADLLATLTSPVGNCVRCIPNLYVYNLDDWHSYYQGLLLKASLLDVG